MKTTEVDPSRPDGLIFVNKPSTLAERKLVNVIRKDAKNHGLFKVALRNGATHVKTTAKSPPLRFTTTDA